MSSPIVPVTIPTKVITHVINGKSVSETVPLTGIELRVKELEDKIGELETHLFNHSHVPTNPIVNASPTNLNMSRFINEQ